MDPQRPPTIDTGPPQHTIPGTASARNGGNGHSNSSLLCKNRGCNDPTDAIHAFCQGCRATSVESRSSVDSNIPITGKRKRTNSISFKSPSLANLPPGFAQSQHAQHANGFHSESMQSPSLGPQTTSQSPYHHPMAYYSHQPPYQSPNPMAMMHPMHQYPYPYPMPPNQQSHMVPSHHSISPNMMHPYPSGWTVPSHAYSYPSGPPHPSHPPLHTHALATPTESVSSEELHIRRHENHQASPDAQEAVRSSVTTDDTRSSGSSPKRIRSEEKQKSRAPSPVDDIIIIDPDEGVEEVAGAVDDVDLKSSLEAQIFQNEEDLYAMLKALHERFEEVSFVGQCPIAEDGLDPKDRARQAADKVYAVTGFKFTVKDHNPFKSPTHSGSLRSRFRCCQDLDKVKLKKRKRYIAAENTSTPASQSQSQSNQSGFTPKFHCKSRLVITSLTQPKLTLTVLYEHKQKHPPHASQNSTGGDLEVDDGTIPQEALDLVKDTVTETLKQLNVVLNARWPGLSETQVKKSWAAFSRSLVEDADG